MQKSPRWLPKLTIFTIATTLTITLRFENLEIMMVLNMLKLVGTMVIQIVKKVFWYQDSGTQVQRFCRPYWIWRFSQNTAFLYNFWTNQHRKASNTTFSTNFDMKFSFLTKFFTFGHKQYKRSKMAARIYHFFCH